MKEVVETILVDKQSYLYLKNYRLITRGFAPLSSESSERCWKKASYKNCDNGIKNYNSYVRIDKFTFSISVPYMKELLTSECLNYIEDGKRMEYFHL